MEKTEIFTALEKLVHKFKPHCTLLQMWELKGGVSAVMYGVEVCTPDRETLQLVLRQPEASTNRSKSAAAQIEYKLLLFLHSLSLPVPTPFFLDESSEFFPTPCLITEFIAGKPILTPPVSQEVISQAAQCLTQLHQINGENPALCFIPNLGTSYKPAVQEQDAFLNETRIREALLAYPQPIKQNKLVLLHGDFWPGNILWDQDQLKAIVDWEDAAIGDPLADVGNARLEFLWAFGQEAMYMFTDLYKQFNTLDFINLPYWDLCAALRPCSKLTTWGLHQNTLVDMQEKHHWFIQQAIEKIPG